MVRSAPMMMMAMAMVATVVAPVWDIAIQISLT